MKADRLHHDDEEASPVAHAASMRALLPGNCCSTGAVAPAAEVLMRRSQQRRHSEARLCAAQSSMFAEHLPSAVSARPDTSAAFGARARRPGCSTCGSSDEWDLITRVLRARVLQDPLELSIDPDYAQYRTCKSTLPFKMSIRAFRLHLYGLRRCDPQADVC